MCDGSDKKQTVILGAKVSKSLFMRCQVLIVGIFPYGHNNLTVDYMKEKHLKNVGIPDAAVRLVFFFYKISCLTLDFRSSAVLRAISAFMVTTYSIVLLLLILKIGAVFYWKYLGINLLTKSPKQRLTTK